MAKKVASELPYNIDAEKAVIGSALINKEAANYVTTSLVEEDFYSGKNRLIFRAMINILNNKHGVVDSITVTDELINMKELENIGGVPYLKECSDSMVSLGALEFYIKAVLDQSVLRNMLTCIRTIDDEYRTQDIENINDFIIESESNFRDSIARRKVSDFEAVSDMAGRMREKMNRPSDEDSKLVGITTGYGSLDDITQGLQRSTMTVIGGRPGMGKTAFALNLAYRVATRGKVAVGIFSLEMDKEKLLQRLIAMESSVALGNIFVNKLTDNERLNVTNAINSISEASIYIDDTRGITLNDIMAKSRKLATTRPDLGMIIVDHIGIIGSSSRMSSKDNRQDEVRKLSVGLRNLAGELKIPIVVLCQLQRDVERRDNKRPLLSDLRESGAIEQDADLVLFLYRDDYYQNVKNKKSGKDNNDSPTKMDMDREKATGLPGDASYLEINIAKNRNGATKTKGFFFYKSFGRIEEPPPSWVEAYDENFGAD